MKYKRYRKDFEHSYAMGAFPALELLAARADLALECLLKEKAVDSEGGQKLIAACEAAGVPWGVHDRQIDAISPKENCNAVVVFKKPDDVADAVEGGNILCLHQPDNMGNLGTILRTAQGFGWRDVAIVRPAVDCWDPRVVRASMGAVFWARISYFDDWAALKAAMGDLSRYALALAEGAAELGKVELAERCVMVFGNEGAGLPDAVVADCTPLIIPQSASVDSYNLGVSVGITLYEHQRQK